MNGEELLQQKRYLVGGGEVLPDFDAVSYNSTIKPAVRKKPEQCLALRPRISSETGLEENLSCPS